MVSLINLFVALLGCLLAEVNIAPQDRVFNKTGSQCVWCSLETIARHFHIAKLYDLTAKYKGTAGSGNVDSVLSSRGIKFYQGREGTHDLQGIRSAISQDWPVAIGLRGVHMITLVDITQDSVKIIDNSDPSLSVQKKSLRWFESAWDGWYVTIPPPVDLVKWSTALWDPVE